MNIGIRLIFFRFFYLYQNNLKFNIKINLSMFEFQIFRFTESEFESGNVRVENIESRYHI